MAECKMLGGILYISLCTEPRAETTRKLSSIEDQVQTERGDPRP